jgi:hypothetical protein
VHSRRQAGVFGAAGHVRAEEHAMISNAAAVERPRCREEGRGGQEPGRALAWCVVDRRLSYRRRLDRPFLAMCPCSTARHCLARRQGLRSQEMPAARGCPPRRRKATPPARCKRHAPARGTSVATFPGHAMCALAPWLGCLPSGPSVLDLVRGLSWLARPPTTGPSSLGHMSSFDHTPLLGRVRLRLGLVAHPRDRAPSVCRRSQHALGCRHDPARPAECARS